MYKILANSLFLGKEVFYMPSCHSTNDLAMDYVSKGDKKEGAIFITDNQTKGKGQRGNSWLSNPGENLTFSVVLKPNFLSASQQFYLNMITSLAVVDTINRILPRQDAIVKWPNDVLIKRKKVCGILIENSLSGQKIGSSVIGIGLNVCQKDFSIPSATSLALEEADSQNNQDILEGLAQRLEGYYLMLKSGDLDKIKEKYCEKLYGYRYPVKLFSEYEFFGELVDIDDYGRIEVVEKNGKHVFDFKEVRFILS